jgi:quercetin dioxygenase-like cupin family protein
MNPQIQILPSNPASTLEFEWGSLTWYANLALGNSTEMTVGRCVLKPGQCNPRHYHPNCCEVLVVFKGSIRHTNEAGGETELNEGDTVSVPQNTWHRATNIGTDEAVLLVAFSSADRQTIAEP